MGYETIGSSSVEWAGSPYPAVREVAERDGSTVVVPVGSLEQHGHHLPTATDTILADAVATTAAERVATERPVLVTPPVWTGHSPHHTPFGGTASLDAGDLLSTLEATADAVLDAGFDGLLFLNGHGGNGAIVSSATSAVGAAHRDVEVLGVTYFDLGADRIDEIRESDRGGAGHAGEVETAMLRHLRPDLVETDAIEGTPWDPPYDRTRDDLSHPGPLTAYADFDAYSETGAVGDPSAATPEHGERFFEVFVDEVADVLRRLHERAR
jgi:creatinine amidohydrolase